MRRIKVFGIVWWVRLAPFLFLFRCATVPPPDLLGARAAYTQAEASAAGQAAPVELHKAKVALEEAEKSFADDPKSETTRDLAYVAERRAQIAEAAGSTALADGQRQAAQAAHATKQGQLLEGAKSDLGKLKEQLAESGRAQQKMVTDLSNERGARAEADSKAAASEEKAAVATDALARLAAKEDQRGVVITLSGSVLFPTNQATLLPAAQARLDEVVTALMEVKERRVMVEGHTDSRGSQDANLALSQRRADAVRSYLVSRGYPGGNIEARGIGRERPVAENATAEGRANNRRVEIIVQRPAHSSLP
jgi:outer membrane protein OmpA-like peptidoglycan-associated protein